MKISIRQVVFLTLITFVISFGTAAQAQDRAYRVTDRQVQTLLDRIEKRTDSFKSEVDRSLDRSNIDGTNREDSINTMISNFEQATDRLKENFNSRRSSGNDVQEVLNQAVRVNSFMQNNRLTPRPENQWNQIRSDLNTLAGYYRVSWDWNNPVYPGDRDGRGDRGDRGDRYGSFDTRLTGTYRLNTSQSDNASNVVERAIVNANYNDNQRDRVRQNLERRLLSPSTLTLEKRGQQVTMSSANAASVSFAADGVKRTETSPNGRTVSVSVTATNNEMTINYEGDRMNDYYITFTPVNNDQLRVTRRIYLENQDQTVTVTSVYDKINQSPQWNNAVYPTISNSGPVGPFMIANNTRVTATLNSPLTARSIGNRERFSMTITSPSQYYGAVIEGNVDGERSGVVTGRANLALNFDTIRMENRQTYRFAGIIEQVREPNGNTVSVNNEGLLRDGSQTTKTVTRAGIGAVLGAIIGAIADGGSGAAIGAGIGAGAGAGTVILQGRDNLELAPGTQFTITAMAPSRVGSN